MLEPTRPDDRRRYEILRVVNRGGMGEIALGRVTGTGGFEKLVILKRLRADAEREDHIAMFDVEQEVMSRIEHPNIVKVFDQPIVDHVPYLAMEYVRGRNLDQIIRAAQQSGRELSVEFSLSVISEVLRGLAFVHRLKDNDGHALGVVHQDMTPSNVMVSFFGEVKVTDFGISYVTSRDGGLRKGVLKGKPRYVAPEVLGGKRVNNTADIYGVGVVLYEMLTGQALFARSSVKETLAAVAKNELPDFASKLGRMGEGVVRLLERSTKKDPTERYRTAEAMAADVLNELAKRGGSVPPATLGYQVRQLFHDDPDVPEMDPALEEAIVRAPVASRPLQAAGLDQTLMELDRLLGKDDASVDLFDVPPEIHRDLSDMPDMDPFMAKTPLPDFVWEAKDEEEILARAHQVFGTPELPPLFSGPESAPPRRPPPLSPPPALVLAPPVAELARGPEPTPAPRLEPSSPAALGVAPAPSASPAPTAPPEPLRLEHPDGPPQAAPLGTSPAASPPAWRRLEHPDGPPQAAPRAPEPRAPLAPTPVPAEPPARKLDPWVIRAAPPRVFPTPAPAPAAVQGQFWMGLAIGLAVGVAVGYLLL